MYKTIKVKLYPTIKQKELLDRHFYAYRFCYNLCLSYKSIMWNDYKISLSKYDLQKELFEIRKESDWLSKCKAECIRESSFSVCESFSRFFKGSGYPKFKKRKSVQSFVAFQSISSKNSKIAFYGSKIKYKTSDRYLYLLNSSKINKCIFKKDLCGDYWACCLIEICDPEKCELKDKIIGIDLGIKNLIVTSDSRIFENKKFLISANFKLIRLQRKYNKSKRGGKNREKLRIIQSKLYRKVFRQKEHYYHHITNELTRESQTIVFENLNVSGMLKNHKLSRNISDVSWGLIYGMLEYKSKWKSINLIKIDRWFPSSKKCSGCGNIKKLLSLGTRNYDCEYCGLSIDRDLNAAINIKNEGLKISGLSMEDTVNGQAYEVGSKSIIIKN